MLSLSVPEKFGVAASPSTSCLELFQLESSNFFSETVFDELLPTRVFGARQYSKLD
jgi:hypothetical protein